MLGFLHFPLKQLRRCRQQFESCVEKLLKYLIYCLLFKCELIYYNINKVNLLTYLLALLIFSTISVQFLVYCYMTR